MEATLAEGLEGLASIQAHTSGVSTRKATQFLIGKVQIGTK